MIGLNNKKIGFIIDSSSNIKDGEIEDVKVIPLGVTIQKNGQIKTYKDGVDLPIDELLSAFADKDSVIKTSQAAMPDMLKAAQEMCSKYDQVFVFPIHKNLSSNINSWKLLKEDFPKLNIVMTCDIGYSFAWTIEEVKDFLKQNEGNEETVQKYVDEHIIHNRVGFLMVEDLAQLIKGGRVKGIKAFIAKLFKIKPVVLFNHDGLENFDRAKDYANLFEIANKHIAKNYAGKQIVKSILFVPYHDNETNLRFISEYGKQYQQIPHDLMKVPTVVLCHTGPKYVAVYFKLK